MTEWQSAHDRNDRERINRARQAAEELFKPTQQNGNAEPATSAPDGASSDERQHRREPRIFAVPPRAPLSTTPEEPAAAKPAPRQAVTRRNPGAVLPSQMGRVRALTSYGLTRAQVAELYGVTVDEIERVIRQPVYAGKAR